MTTIACSSRLPRARSAVLLMSLATLAIAGCGGGGGALGEPTYACTPACPTGTRCTATGCVSDSGPLDLAAASVDLPATCSPACSGGAPYCNPQTNLCVACLTDDNCPVGSVCKVAGATTACVAGCSSDARCGGGTSRCCAGQCTDTASDGANCGGCGTTCNGVNATATCQAGACALGGCLSGYGDCDRDAANGCETNVLIDTANCGACGSRCSIPHGVSGCASTCYVAACQFGWDDCNGKPEDGCEVSVLADAKNCGACGNSCTPPPHASPTCINAACALAKCDFGWADCDNNPQNGCESNIGSDAKNCGGCGLACAQGLICKNAGCTCPQCNFANASSSCVNNVCVMDKCVDGFADCNMDPKDGCEVDVTGDPKNCGACAMACPMNMPGCGNGKCTNLKCSEVAKEFCKNKGMGFRESDWRTAFPNQPGGSIFCTTNGAGSDCDTCNTYNQLVWKDVAVDACNSGQKLVAGRIYAGHSPCTCKPNLLECGDWPMQGCVPD